MTAIHHYFNGERNESVLFIVVGILLMLFASYFFFFTKTPFWRGVAIPLALVAVLEMIVGYTIFMRSPKDLARVEYFATHEPNQLQQKELPRMETVMRNFVLYRGIEIGLLLLAIIVMYTGSSYTFWKGIGLGLFIQVSLVLCLDFFAEKRGHFYINYLQTTHTIYPYHDTAK